MQQSTNAPPRLRRVDTTIILCDLPEPAQQIISELLDVLSPFHGSVCDGAILRESPNSLQEFFMK